MNFPSEPFEPKLLLLHLDEMRVHLCFPAPKVGKESESNVATCGVNICILGICIRIGSDLVCVGCFGRIRRRNCEIRNSESDTAANKYQHLVMSMYLIFIC